MKETIIKTAKASELNNTIFLPDVEIVVSEISIGNVLYISHSTTQENGKRIHFMRKPNGKKYFLMYSKDGYTSSLISNVEHGTF